MSSRARVALALVVALAMIAAVPGPLASQAAGSPAAFASDSGVWQRVLAYVVASLSAQIVHAAMDTSPQPWELHLPAADPHRPLVEARLRRILRPRPPTGADTVFPTLDIGPLAVAGDTARVLVRISVTRRCPGSARVTGHGTDARLVLVRQPWYPGWGPASSEGGTEGDRIGCPRPRPGAT